MPNPDYPPDAVPSVTQQGYNVTLLKSAIGGYNSGLIEHGGELLLCTRTIEIFTNRKGEEKYRFKLVWQKPTGAKDGVNMVHHRDITINNFHPDDYDDDPPRHAEDPRVLRGPDGSIYITFTESRDYPNRPPSLRLARIRPGHDMGEAELLPLIEYRDNGFAPQKNWEFFFLGERMFFSYWPYPHRVVEVDPTTMRVLNEWNAKDHQDYCWQYGPLAGGTPPIPWDGKMVSFYHGYMPHVIRRRRYYLGAYTFEARPPFRVLEITPPLMRGSLNDPTNFTPPNHAGLPLVVFPCGLIRRTGAPENEVIVSMGVNDSYSALVDFDLNTLPWRDVTAMKDPIIHYFHTTDAAEGPMENQVRRGLWVPVKGGGVCATLNPVSVHDLSTRFNTTVITAERYQELINSGP